MVRKLHRIYEIDIETQQLQWKDGRFVPNITRYDMTLNTKNTGEIGHAHAYAVSLLAWNWLQY